MGVRGRGKPGVQVNGSEERDTERGGRWREFEGAQAWLPRTAGVDAHAGVLGLLGGSRVGGRLLRFGSNHVRREATPVLVRDGSLPLPWHNPRSVHNATTNACQTKRRAEGARDDT